MLIVKLESYIFHVFQTIVSLWQFSHKLFKTLCRKRLSVGLVLAHMKYIGVDSLAIIILTGSFTGLALALQTYVGFSKFGVDSLLGILIALGMTRELGPVLTGLMVMGRSGSAIAAEIGTMQISEQVDALKTLCIDPYQYLIVPRIIASMIVMPCLALFSMGCGILGGYFFCAYVLEINSEVYLAGIRKYIVFSDVLGGMIKTSCFGFIMSSVSSYYGYTAKGGSQAVGNATTRSVVAGSVLILVANYFLSSILFDNGFE